MKPHFKIYFSLFLCILLGASVFAQEEDGATPPEGYFSTIENQEPENICPAPHVEFRSLVMYERSSTVLLKVNSLDRTMTSLYLVAKGKDETRRDVEDGFVEIQGLKNNLTYDVMAYNECGEMATVGKVNTFFKEGAIEVSQELIRKFGAWGKDENHPRLIEYLDQLSEIHFLERLAYAQQFYFEGKPFPESVKTDISIGNSSIFKLLTPLADYKGDQDGCNCYWTTTSMLVAPFASNLYPQLYPSIGTEIDMQNNHYLKKHSYMRTGPCHTETAQIEGWCASSYYYDYLPQGAVNNTSSSWMMMCDPKPGYRGSCKCKYTLRVRYLYQTKLNVKSEIVSNASTWLCGSKSSAAAAEEFAVMTMTDDDGNIYPLDAGQASVRSSCSRSFNTDFLVNLVAYYGAAAPIAIAAAGETMPTAGQIDTLVTAIQTLIQTPVNTNVTACSDQIVPASLLDGSRAIDIESNKLVKFNLWSYTHLYAGGTTAWRSRAGSSSNYGLAVSYGTHRSTIPNSSSCCTDRFARWIGSGSANSPLSGQATTQQLAAHLTAYGPWNNLPIDPYTGVPNLPRIPLAGNPYDLIYTSASSISGPQPADCFVSSAGRLAPPDELHQDGQGIYLETPNEGKYDRFTVFDSSGKLVLEGTVSAGSKQVLDFGSTFDVPSGIYLIYVTGKDAFTSFKFTKL